MLRHPWLLIAVLLAAFAGCASPPCGRQESFEDWHCRRARAACELERGKPAAVAVGEPHPATPPVQAASHQADPPPADPPPADPPPADSPPADPPPADSPGPQDSSEELPKPAADSAAASAGESLALDDVLNSVYASYPLLRAALQGRTIAEGDQIAAAGEFDLKLKAASADGPIGYYQTYRQDIYFDQPLFGGGNVFANYRIGRGSFQPWYLERQTNDGGEFKAGFLLPLAQNRTIDERRAAVWNADWARQGVEPQIQTELVQFLVLASLAYWDWLAAGQNVRVAEGLLELAQDRDDGLRKQVARGEKAAIELTDNQRLILSREAKLIDARRKLDQAAIKLSLFLRDDVGQPRVPGKERLPPEFPSPAAPDAERLEFEIAEALRQHPALATLNFQTAQLRVDLAQARNLLQPQVDAGLIAAQDVGGPSSDKRDKSPFELEALVLVSVPVQRRKAQGKIQALEGKLAQVDAKKQITYDKIATEARAAFTALVAAHQRIDKAKEAFALARIMSQAERRKFAAGDSDLLTVNLREQQGADAAVTVVEALQEYFAAEAVYRAALATDVQPPP